MRVFTLLILFYISISSNNVSANESSDESYQEVKDQAVTQDDSVPITKPLNLTIDPNLIKEPKDQQNAVTKKKDQVLPDLFKDKSEHNLSIEGGTLIKDKATKTEVMDSN